MRTSGRWFVSFVSSIIIIIIIFSVDEVEKDIQLRLKKTRAKELGLKAAMKSKRGSAIESDSEEELEPFGHGHVTDFAPASASDKARALKDLV